LQGHVWLQQYGDTDVDGVKSVHKVLKL